MAFNVYKYLPKKKKKRNLFQKIKTKLYAHKKQVARKRKEWESKYLAESPTAIIDREFTVKESIEYFSQKEAYRALLVAISPYLVIGAIFYVIKYHWETTLAIGVLVLQGIGWIVGVIFALFIAKATACATYKTFVYLTARFIADVMNELKKLNN